jgi:CubicO group peptidase (beta-lactamase class C family)
VSAAQTVAPLPARLDQLLKNFARDHPSLPGVALAVRTPTLSWAGAAGFADRASRKPLTVDAGFRIASVTKAFTAAAILRLVENGKLALKDPIAQHLSPATLALLRHRGYNVDRIRIKHLLQHTSGLYDYAGDPADCRILLRGNNDVEAHKGSDPSDLAERANRSGQSAGSVVTGSVSGAGEALERPARKAPAS